MGTDLNTVAQKKLKSRITKFKKVNKDIDEKNKFFNNLGVSVEVFLPTRDPEDEESIIFIAAVDGKVLYADYSYMEADAEPISLPIDDKDLKVLSETFQDVFKLNFDV